MKWIPSLVTACFLALSVPYGAMASPPSWATANRPADAPLSVPAFDKIHGDVQQKGSTRVIVRLRNTEPTGTAFVPDANLKDPGAKAAQKKALRATQDKVANRLPMKSRGGAKKPESVPFMAVEVDEAGLTELLNSPEIDLIEEDLISRPDLSQSVPLIGSDGSGTFSGFTGAGQAVAILDTGVDKTHPFLAGKVISEACYSTTYGSSSYSVCPNGQNSQTGTGSGVNCNTAINGCTHGTHVAGIAAGNTSGLSGVAKDAAIIAIQVFAVFPNSADCGGSPPCAMSYSSDQLLALDRVYALKDTYNIASVNMSLGGGSYTSNCDANNTSLKAAIDNLRAAGIATVIASGNSGYTSSISAPACISSAISVGATTKSDTVASYSNSASILKLLAPGSSIYSSTPGGYYASWNGTSMATPHVAGAWAVMKSKKPTATVDEILNAFMTTGQSITDSRNGIAKPRIKVDAALGLISSLNLTLTPSVASPQYVGSSVTFTAAVAGGGSYEYEFYLLAPGGSWVKKQAYSSAGTWAWNTTGLAAGTYQVKVWVRAAGTTPSAGFDSFQTVTYVLNSPPAASGLTVTPNVASPQTVGTSVTFTAAASGSTGNYDYEFYLLSPGSSTWVKKQAYSSTATYAWNTTGLATGTYQLSVWAKTTGNTPTNGSYDASATISYVVNPLPASSGVSLSANVASPQNVGTAVTFTASGSGGSGSYQYEYYLLAPGSSTWVKQQAYISTATWAWNTTGLAAGTYQISVWAKTAGSTPANGSYDKTATVSYVLNPIAASVTPSVASPQLPGTTVTFTAAISGGTGSYDYEFYLLAPGTSTWVKKQAYSTTATWAWNTTGLAAGTYQLLVWAKKTGTTPTNGSYDTTATASYVISPPPAANGLTVTPSVASPQVGGTTVTFTAAGSGSSSGYQYEFYLLAPGTSTWVKKQAYSSTATYAWDTTGLTTGTYQLLTWVKAAGSTPANGSYDTTATTSYVVSAQPAATGLTVTPSVASPQIVGTAVTFTAAGSGSTGSYQYEFYLQAPGSSSWVKQQAYSSTATWAWNTTGLATGTYKLSVWVKTAGTTPANGSYDTTATISYVVSPQPAATGLTVTPSVASPQLAGTAVTFTAAGSGSTGSYQYEFYLLAPGTSTWVKKQAYSSTATYAWNTTGLATGTYQLSVWVKTTGTTPANGSYDTTATISYVVSPQPAATGLTVTPSVASPQLAGTAVTFTAAGSGSTGGYQYEFYLQAPGSTSWVRQQAYSATTTWAWNTTGLAIGTYKLCVWVKAAGTTPANGSYDTSAVINYVISPPPTASGLTITPSVASPQPLGTAVTFTAAGSGGSGSYDYEFYLLAPGGSWVKKQAYSTTATYAWNTTGLAAGTYQLCVWVKTSGSTPANGLYDTSAVISYVVNALPATTGLTVTPSVPSPQNAGTAVTLTAAGSGGNGNYDYEFYLLSPGSSTWVKKQAYSSTATYAWNTTGLAPGTYQFCVWVKTTGTNPANGSYDKYTVLTYVVQ